MILLFGALCAFFGWQACSIVRDIQEDRRNSKEMDEWWAERGGRPS